MSDLGLGCKTGPTKVDIVGTVADSMKHHETRICEIPQIRVRITIYPTNFLGHLRWKCWRMASDPMSFGRLLGRRGCMGHHGTATFGSGQITVVTCRQPGQVVPDDMVYSLAAR